MLMLLCVGVMAVLAAGYLVYGTFIARQYRLDDAAQTPAHAKRDGVDFVPTRPFYLLGQHFSAIAAAGPIVGPIAACLAFGWAPCLAWIVVGVVLIGAVHDFSALVASVRHGASSVADLAREHLGRNAWLAMVMFIWIALVYVIVAFTDVTAQTFVGLSDELLAAPGAFSKGGAVAAASTMYLALALVMGVVQKRWNPPMWAMTVIFVPATLGAVYAGTRVDHLLNLDARSWHVIILVYCFVSSLLPMWLLQQPRGYLGGFVLYLAIAVGLAGVLLGGFEIKQPAVRPVADYGAWVTGAPGQTPAITSLVFPFLFVTIACGACSGFHGLICGGTTSKQVSKESHCKPIAFGAMLLEGLVAVIALATVMIVADSERAGRTPGVLYGDGLALFLTRLIDPGAPDVRSSGVFLFAATFGAMAFSTFVFDTLDVSTRLGRYLLCELLGTRSRVAGALAAGLTVGVPLALLLTSPDPATLAALKKPPTYMIFWTLFGTANQLLASLTLLGVTIWLWKSRRRVWYTLAPTIFVFTTTTTGLIFQMYAGATALAMRFSEAALHRETGGVVGRGWTNVMEPAILNGLVATGLLALALGFLLEAIRVVRRGRDVKGVEHAHG